jgi:hypothetical protein
MSGAKMKCPGDRGHFVTVALFFQLFFFKFFQLDFSSPSDTLLDPLDIPWNTAMVPASRAGFYDLISLLMLFLLFRHVTNQLGLFWKPKTKPDKAQT